MWGKVMSREMGNFRSMLVSTLQQLIECVMRRCHICSRSSQHFPSVQAPWCCAKSQQRRILPLRLGCTVNQNGWDIFQAHCICSQHLANSLENQCHTPEPSFQTSQIFAHVRQGTIEEHGQNDCSDQGDNSTSLSFLHKVIVDLQGICCRFGPVCETTALFDCFAYKLVFKSLIKSYYINPKRHQKQGVMKTF